jgi:hypothetical protein
LIERTVDIDKTSNQPFCTLPIFLAVVGTSVTAGTVWSSVGSLVVYGLRMGSVVLALTLVAAVFKAGMATRLRVLPPYVGRIGTITLLIAGAYIAPLLAHRRRHPRTHRLTWPGHVATSNADHGLPPAAQELMLSWTDPT